MTGFEAGQRWAYAAPPEIQDSRIVIGAIVEFEGGRRIACCAVTGALERGEEGKLARVTIPFLPLTLDALSGTVTEPDGTATLPEEFAGHLAAWSADPRGASYFTVPFEGSLERMIGLQMAAIIEQP
jgi:hypothetical protein